jgi:hypothetical protein
MDSLKRTLYYSLILFVVPILVFGSCAKEKEPEVVIVEQEPVDKSPILVNKWWQLAGYYTGEVQQPIETPVEVKFLSLGVFNFRTEGGNYDSTWEWADNQTKIILGAGTEFEQTWDVLDLRNNQLSMKRGQGAESEQWVFFPQ